MQATKQKHSDGATSSVTQFLLSLAGFCVVAGFVGLSMYAVGEVQLKSHPDDPLRFWYMACFVLCEIWVAVGFTLMARRFGQRQFAAGVIALLLWFPALGLSGLQESRYHALNDSEVDATIAPELTKRTNALARISEIEDQLKDAETPPRPSDAVQAELDLYAARPNYPTKTATLRAELATALAYEKLQGELVTHRKTVEDTAYLAAENSDAKKIGQTFTVPLLKWEVSADATVWTLIVFMMGVKAFGPWLIIGSALKAEAAAAQKASNERIRKAAKSAKTAPARKPRAKPTPKPVASPVADMVEKVEAKMAAPKIEAANVNTDNDADAMEDADAPLMPKMRWEKHVDRHGRVHRVKVFAD